MVSKHGTSAFSEYHQEIPPVIFKKRDKPSSSQNINGRKALPYDAVLRGMSRNRFFQFIFICPNQNSYSNKHTAFDYKSDSNQSNDFELIQAFPHKHLAYKL